MRRRIFAEKQCVRRHSAEAVTNGCIAGMSDVGHYLASSAVSDVGHWGDGAWGVGIWLEVFDRNLNVSILVDLLPKPPVAVEPGRRLRQSLAVRVGTDTQRVPC